MTPAELITRKLKARIEASGATLPVFSLLLEALAGEKHEAKSSCIAVNVHVAEQHAEPLPLYSFNATVALTVSLDDDKGGSLFAENYNDLWAAFDFLARDDNCVELGDEDDEPEEGRDPIQHVFAVDGFQLGSGDEPDYQEDDNGGTWTTTFSSTLTGRAN